MTLRSTNRVISKSVFWSELLGTREYAANFFFIMYSESVGTHLQKTRVIRTYPGLHVKYRWPIWYRLYDNGTSNALLTPFTPELSTLGYIRNQKTKLYQNSVLVGKKIFLVDFGKHPSYGWCFLKKSASKNVLILKKTQAKISLIMGGLFTETARLGLC